MLRLLLTPAAMAYPPKDHAAKAAAVGVTRHPGMGAVEEPEVPLREPSWNERPTAMNRKNAGVYRLLCVNVNGMRQLEANRPVLGSGA